MLQLHQQLMEAVVTEFFKLWLGVQSCGWYSKYVYIYILYTYWAPCFFDPWPCFFDPSPPCFFDPWPSCFFDPWPSCFCWPLALFFWPLVTLVFWPLPPRKLMSSRSTSTRRSSSGSRRSSHCMGPSTGFALTGSVNWVLPWLGP